MDNVYASIRDISRVFFVHLAGFTYEGQHPQVHTFECVLNEVNNSASYEADLRHSVSMIQYLYSFDLRFLPRRMQLLCNMHNKKSSLVLVGNSGVEHLM